VIAIKRTIGLIQNFSALLLLLGAFIGLSNIFARYIFKNAFIWGDEAGVYIFIWVLFLSLCCITYEKRHLSTEVLKFFLEKRSALLSKAIDLLIVLATIVVSLFMVYISINPVKTAYLYGRFSDTGIFPMALIYLAIPLGFLLNAIASIFNLISSFVHLKK